MSSLIYQSRRAILNLAERCACKSACQEVLRQRATRSCKGLLCFNRMVESHYSKTKNGLCEECETQDENQSFVCGLISGKDTPIIEEGYSFFTLFCSYFILIVIFLGRKEGEGVCDDRLATPTPVAAAPTLPQIKVDCIVLCPTLWAGFGNHRLEHVVEVTKTSFKTSFDTEIDVLGSFALYVPGMTTYSFRPLEFFELVPGVSIYKVSCYNGYFFLFNFYTRRQLILSMRIPFQRGRIRTNLS